MKQENSLTNSRIGRGRAVISFSSAIYVSVGLTLWLTTHCLAAPTVPPPPGQSLGPDEQAMLEALVEKAIAMEELARTRRQEGKVTKRFSSPPAAEHHEEYGPPLPDYKTKSFSLWSFKKAILGALLQSVKAITGGVIALSGQLIKVKGHLVAAKGKVLETKGDVITEFGKHIATKALLTPVHVSNYDHSSPGTSSGSSSYSHPPPSSHGGHYPAALPPPPSYGPPSHSSHSPHPPSSSYETPPHSFVDYQGPPPSNNYLPPTASFHSGPESWLMAAGHYAEPTSGHHDIQHLQRELHHPIQKKEIPRALQAGLILLKPVKEQDLQHSTVFQTPHGFSKQPTVIEIQESKLNRET